MNARLFQFARFATLAVPFALVACSSDGGGGASQNSASSSTVAWTTVYGDVLTQCKDHHSGANAAGNLDLSTESLAFANLVGIAAQGPSCGGSAILRVDPKSAADSLLYQKITGTQTCGAAMPDEEPLLGPSEIALVKSWIDEGAPND